ncbi:transient receptor potential cation channel subfamily a member 1-like [Gigaspora margarita]|uniref:Transient receptor potential cation channel subfamily a member 1-like n=1 Tax=Gigaspora margarita TaxID=4874 RepID=A0A8H4EIW9_GIGMA|nr:transient receptor potential cation channel subfamily a member 1-like [Gigaspora margarita]
MDPIYDDDYDDYEDDPAHVSIDTGYSGYYQDPYYQDPSRLTVPGDISSRRGSDSGIVPDNVDAIAEIVCSPNMKYVATTFKYIYEKPGEKSGEKSSAEQQDAEDPTYEYDGKISKVSLWSVTETKELLKVSEIMAHKIIEPEPKLWAVSDDKYIIFRTNYFYYNFEIFDAKGEGEHKDLFFPNPHNIVNNLAFTKSGNLVVALTGPTHHIYIFNLRHNEWIESTKFELSYFCDAFITVEGKLILFDDQIFQLTKWDISTLAFETNCMIDWCYKVWHVEVNQGGELLAVYAVYLHEDTPKKSKLYIYSLKNGINMAIHDYDESKIVDSMYFIAYEAGERLLIRSRNPFNDELSIELMDPFTLKTPVSAKKLLESNEQIRDPFIIKSDKKSDNIIGVINDSLGICELLELFQTDWITYLRKELGDYNRIFVLSDTEKIAKMINDELDDEEKYFIDKENSPKIEDRPTYPGKFLTWRLSYKNPNTSGSAIEIEAQVLDQISGDWRPVEGESTRTVTPNFQPPEHTRKLKIIQCECLNNDDLLMLSNFGVLIWTVYPPKGIRLHYYWGRAKIRNIKTFNLYLGHVNENPFHLPTNLKTYANAFPDSKFQIIIKNKNLTFGEKKDSYFKELLEDYISDKYFIINYGSILMDTFLFLKDDEWVEKFCQTCYDLTFSAEGLRSTSDIQLLSIIIEVFPQLLQRHPIYLARFLSQTGFVMPLADSELILDSEIASLLPTQHLAHFGTYNQLSTKTSLIETFVAKIMYYWNKLIGKTESDFDTTPQPSDKEESASEFEATIKLIIPFPKFVNYPKNYSTWEELRNPSPSYFTSSIDLELYKYWNSEALINFKWKTYGLRYYLISWSIYSVFLCCYTSVVTLNDFFTTGEQVFLLYLSIGLGFYHLIHEFRQFIHDHNDYIRSPWNYFDIGAIIFTMLTSFIWIKNGTAPTWATTIATLLLELKFLFYFRAFRFVGVYFAMIFGVAKRAYSFLTIIAFVVFAFAHSLHLLLRPSATYSLDEPSYSDDPNDPWNLATTYNPVDNDGTISTQPSLIEPPDSSTNMFTMFGTSLLAVYLLLTGDTSPIGSWSLQDNLTLVVLMFTFSFFTTIYFMNLFIGLLSNEISDTNNNEFYLIQKAEILAEIELFYMLPHQRRNKAWFPEIIIYIAHVSELRDLIREIQIGNWKGFEKPFLSQILLKAVQVQTDEIESEEETIKKLKDDMRELKEMVERLINNTGQAS